MAEREKAEDQVLGKFVYCKSHLRAHGTGWCTVGVENKVGLKATTQEEATAEARSLGFKIYGDVL